MNIFMPCGFIFCDVVEYSLLMCEIFYHVDKGPVSKHINYFFLEVFMDENGGQNKWWFP